MLTPHEVFVKKIIPNIKGLIAVKLINEYGITQIEAARLLNVTQAAISQYITKDINIYIKLLNEIGLEKDFYLPALDNILSGIINQQILINYFNDLWYKLLTSNRICTIHRKFNILLNNCNECYTTYIYKPIIRSKKEEIINEVERAFSILSKVPEFKELIPEVYTNMVRALPNPNSINDVVAYPGRIIPTKDGVKVLGRPAFGSSQHLAKVLIRVNKVYPYVLAAMNIKFDDKVKRAVEISGLNYCFSEAEVIDNEEGIINGIVRSLEKYGFKPIIFDRGGKGFEANTYIFGIDLYDVIDKVMSIIWGLRIDAKR